MNDFQPIADRVEIEALRAEFTDASMMYDWDRFASLFTEDGARPPSRKPVPSGLPVRNARRRGRSP